MYPIGYRRNNMGLDNGIQLITKQNIDLDDWDIIPEYVHIEFDEFDTNEYKDGYYYMGKEQSTSC